MPYDIGKYEVPTSLILIIAVLALCAMLWNFSEYVKALKVQIWTLCETHCETKGFNEWDANGDGCTCMKSSQGITGWENKTELFPINRP